MVILIGKDYKAYFLCGLVKRRIYKWNKMLLKDKNMSNSMYQNISSTTLFNFTEKFEYLLSNLQSGFFCGDIYEKLPFSKGVGYKVPMVCFCDIPLGMVKKHLNWYGNYGIGIKREYARSNKVNPVWYIHKDNPVIAELFKSKNHFELRDSPILPFLKQFLGYQKPINANKERQKKFYDEREWRYIPLSMLYKAELIKGQNHRINNILVRQSRRITRMPLVLDWVEYIIIFEEAEKAALIRVC